MATHVRQQVEAGVAGERADSERDEELQQVVVEDLAGERNDGHAEQAHQADAQDGQRRAKPH